MVWNMEQVLAEEGLGLASLGLASKAEGFFRVKERSDT